MPHLQKARATRKNAIRYAPSFTPGELPRAGGAHPYIVKTLAAFVGWTQPNGLPQRGRTA